MDSKPQPFSWPGLAGNPKVTAFAAPAPDQSELVNVAVDPAQAAADAATAGHQQGFDRGYAEGLAKGEEDAFAQVQKKYANVDAIFSEAEAFVEQWQMAQVELVQLIGSKHLLQELLTDEERLDALLRQGRQLLPKTSDFVLACHPDVEALLAKRSGYSLVVDAELPSGALELRQGSSCLQLNLEAVVAQAFANLDRQGGPVLLPNVETPAEPCNDLAPNLEAPAESQTDAQTEVLSESGPKSGGGQ